MSKSTLSKMSPSHTGKFKSKEEALEATEKLQKKLYDLLYLMFADDRYSLLIVLHGIDTSGKDGVVRHMYDSSNPQGIRVYNFKQPSKDEQRHDFLWRCHQHTPECGLTSIFNRSYYEEVTTVRIHPEYLEQQRLPDVVKKDPDFFKKRYRQINDFERMLTEKGTVVLKFFLHISKEEQKERLQDRLKDSKRNWKFSEDDVKERKHWNQYQKAFDLMLEHTSTEHAPWNVIPADHKWYRNYLISEKIVETLSELKMKFPKAGRKPRSIR